MVVNINKPVSIEITKEIWGKYINEIIVDYLGSVLTVHV